MYAPGRSSGKGLPDDENAYGMGGQRRFVGYLMGEKGPQ